MTEQPGQLKRFLSELSSVLVPEQSTSSSEPAHSDHSDTNVKAYGAFDLSRDVFNTVMDRGRDKQRKLRVADDLVIIAEPEAGIYTDVIPENSIGEFDRASESEPADYLSNQSPGAIDQDQFNGFGVQKTDFDSEPRSEMEKPKGQFSAQQLRHLMASLTQQRGSSKKYTLPFQANEELRVIVDELIDIISERFNTLLDKGDTRSLDKPTILKLFSLFGTVNESTTNDALFEICRRYLNLEDANDLEVSLFS